MVALRRCNGGKRTRQGNGDTVKEFAASFIQRNGPFDLGRCKQIDGCGRLEMDSTQMDVPCSRGCSITACVTSGAGHSRTRIQKTRVESNLQQNRTAHVGDSDDIDPTYTTGGRSIREQVSRNRVSTSSHPRLDPSCASRRAGFIAVEKRDPRTLKEGGWGHC